MVIRVLFVPESQQINRIIFLDYPLQLQGPVTRPQIRKGDGGRIRDGKLGLSLCKNEW
jgi:hypothetical protein